MKNMPTLVVISGGPGVLDRFRLTLNRSLNQVEGKLKPRGHKQNSDRRQSPVQRISRQDQPSEYQQQKSCRLYQAAAQIVQNLPLRNQRDRIWDFPARFIPHLRQEPSRNLPVPSQPAMFAAVVGAVM